MSDYARVTVWGDGANLTASDLNAEFDAIKAVINGGLEESNFQDGEIEKKHVINAGSARFQSGGLENAELVAAAVAEAVAGNVKWVLVPRTMFGYAEDASFTPTIFDTGVAMVHEGQMMPGQDPVAYGAKPDDALVDDQPSFDAANDAAAAAAIGGNPGGAYVSLSLPGEYQLDSDVTLNAGVGYIEYPGVTLAGVGVITSATSGVTKQGVIPWRGLVNRVRTQSASGTIGAGATATATSNNIAGIDPADWMLVYVEASLDEDSAGTPTTGYGNSPVVSTTNLTFNVDTIHDAVGSGEFNFDYTVTNNDGGSPHDYALELSLFFVKKQAL